MDNGEIKVFVRNGLYTYKRILKRHEYTIDDNCIKLPKNHYSKEYVESIIDGIKWEEYPDYSDKNSCQEPKLKYIY